MNYYRDSFKDVNKTYDGNRQEEKISAELLQNFQKADYNYEKLQMKKDLILLYFQSFLLLYLMFLYYTSPKTRLFYGNILIFYDEIKAPHFYVMLFYRTLIDKQFLRNLSIGITSVKQFS